MPSIRHKYNIKCGHTLGRIQYIYILNRIDICCRSCRLETQTVAPNIPGFQGIKQCIKYMYIQPHKLIFYPSNPYDGSNFIILTWGGNQIEYYTTHNCLECHQDADHDLIINRRRSVSVIIHTILGVSFW